MSGIVAWPKDITSPPVDDLLKHANSRYALMIFATRRTRQTNSYDLQLERNMIQYVSLVVETAPDERPLAVALREINEGLLSLETDEEA